jgi:hypothetical protein
MRGARAVIFCLVAALPGGEHAADPLAPPQNDLVGERWF